MAKGIYERKGKKGDITYYIRYQYKTTERRGIGDHQRPKGKGRQKIAWFHAREGTGSLESERGEIAQGRFNLEKSESPIP